MKLSKKQKRVLISLPFVIIVVSGLFALIVWLIGGDIAKALRSGLAVATGCLLVEVLSLILNRPKNLKDE